MAHRLHRVNVEQYPGGPGNGSDLGHGLNGADLIVGSHHGDQDGIGPEGGLHRRRVHPALGVHRQVGHLIALLFQVLGRVEDGVVLDGGGNDVPALLLTELRHPAQGPVVGLGAAGGEIELLRPGVQTGGDVRPGGFQIGLGLLTKGVETGGIAISLLQMGHHSGQRSGGKPGGGGVIGIEKTGHRIDSFRKLFNSFIHICLLGL